MRARPEAFPAGGEPLGLLPHRERGVLVARHPGFQARRLLQHRKWFDNETSCSCSKKRSSFYDEHTATCPRRHYGDIFVDLERTKAFGIDGCLVDAVGASGGEISLKVTPRLDVWSETVIRATGGRPSGSLEVNGVRARRTAAGEYAILLQA